MKKIKTKYIVIIVNVILSAFAVVSAVFAWYTNTEQVANMSFDILQIDSLVSVYKANDSNYNGVPNLSEGENIGKYYKIASDDDESGDETGYYSYANCYYNEKYDFTYVNQKYALEHDSSANLFDRVEIGDIAPSKIYCFKFEITNYSSVENKMGFSFDQFEGDLESLSDFEVRLGIVNGPGEVTFGDWASFVDDGEYSAPVVADELSIPAWSKKVGTNENINGRKDLWLQVRLKSSATKKLTDFVLPKYRISLTVEISTSSE